MKFKVLNNLTALDEIFEGELNQLVSETVPDQALSPQELLRRFVQGKPLNVGNDFIYDSDQGVNLPEFDKMDKLDLLHRMQEHSYDVKELHNEFEYQKKKKMAEKRAESLTEDKTDPAPTQTKQTETKDAE